MIELETAASQFYANDIFFCWRLNSDPGAEIDSESNCITPLHVAAGTGNFLLWQTLTDMVEDIQPKDEIGKTPFHYAAYKGHLTICQNIV